MPKTYADQGQAAGDVVQGPDLQDDGKKKDLRGKTYDEQVKMVSPDQSGQDVQAAADAEAAAAVESGAVPEEEKSEADRLRESIAGRAEHWKGKEFMSQGEIDDVREKTGMKNYTTCIDFAAKTMREGTGEVYGKDWKKAGQTARMLSQIKGDWDKEIAARGVAAAYEKTVARFDKSIKEMQDKRAKVVADIEHLRRPAEDGEKELAVKQRHIRADAYEKQTLKAYDGVIKQLERQRERFQAKVDKNLDKASDLATKNTAMIKASDGMGGGRPKMGEYIILAQAPKGGSYGVSKETKVFLAGGSFKHIAVFMEVMEEDKGDGVERWKVIDGGGTNGKETQLFVRLADRMVFPAYQGAKPPEAGSAAGSQLAGWIDMDEMIAMRDRQAAGGAK